jgi:hypothetical protein
VAPQTIYAPAPAQERAKAPPVTYAPGPAREEEKRKKEEEEKRKREEKRKKEEEEKIKKEEEKRRQEEAKRIKKEEEKRKKDEEKKKREEEKRIQEEEKRIQEEEKRKKIPPPQTPPLSPRSSSSSSLPTTDFPALMPRYGPSTSETTEGITYGQLPDVPKKPRYISIPPEKVPFYKKKMEEGKIKREEEKRKKEEEEKMKYQDVPSTGTQETTGEGIASQTSTESGGIYKTEPMELESTQESPVTYAPAPKPYGAVPSKGRSPSKGQLQPTLRKGHGILPYQAAPTKPPEPVYSQLQLKPDTEYAAGELGEEDLDCLINENNALKCVVEILSKYSNDQNIKNQCPNIKGLNALIASSGMQEIIGVIDEGTLKRIKPAIPIRTSQSSSVTYENMPPQPITEESEYANLPSTAVEGSQQGGTSMPVIPANKTLQRELQKAPVASKSLFQQVKDAISGIFSGK